MDAPHTPDPKLLNAVRSPLAFNALTLLVLTGIMGGVLGSGLPDSAKELSLAFYFVGLAAAVIRVDILFRKDPRGLAYGPNEYLEESRLEHQRRMKGIQR